MYYWAQGSFWPLSSLLIEPKKTKLPTLTRKVAVVEVVLAVVPF